MVIHAPCVDLWLQDYQLSDGGEDDGDSDIKDLEFRLSHNLQQLQVTSTTSNIESSTIFELPSTENIGQPHFSNGFVIGLFPTNLVEN